MFPPRERGWSPGADHHLGHGPVSPARAGMVPAPMIAISAFLRFPRASGDGPQPRDARGRWTAFPPRERGWSRPGCHCTKQREVSPARAGMVPPRGHASVYTTSFPRASGDGPEAEQAQADMQQFPPRERGWSLGSSIRAVLREVSPARAGMVPTALQSIPAPDRFPRASGDGPSITGDKIQAGTFPPRERGWSPASPTLLPSCLVSPARAGMVPNRARCARSTWSFPRASGDGPLSTALSALVTWFPPRERGWSPRAAQVASAARVSPARAGMVPPQCAPGSPATSFPRASGDGPTSASGHECAHWFPPRERGWSLVKISLPQDPGVSPARAGMVPRHGAGRRH